MAKKKQPTKKSAAKKALKKGAEKTLQAEEAAIPETAAEKQATRQMQKNEGTPGETRKTAPAGGGAGKLTELWRTRSGIIGWLSAVDHKSIGMRYILTGFMFFAFAGIGALLMRTQLAVPENTFLNADQYDRIFTTHGVTMMFLFAVPIMLGVGIYFVPLMIGARDVPFPRANAFGYYLYLLSGVILWLSLVAGTGPDGGWFAYTPLSEPRFTPSYGMDVYQQLINGTEIAALVAATELIIVIFKFRAPGMSMNRMPVFVWAMLVTSFMVEFAMPTLLIATNLLGFDRSINTAVFNPNLGGNPLLWQHLFWFFGHPEVYIIFIPGLGMVSEILGTFTRRAVVGYPLLVISLVTIGVFSFGLWVHHMFTTGLPVMSMSVFTAASMVISIPTGIQIFSNLATLWHGQLNLKTPLLYVLGFIFTFVIGGISGVMVASVPFDLQAQDSYFLVAHLHYVLIGGAVFPLLGAMYYWFPKMTGKMLNESLGKWNFWLTVIGFNVAFFPMHLTGLLGMPRRVYTYLPGLGWDVPNFISTIGAYVLGIGLLILLINVIITVRSGEEAQENPWGAGTLEWATASPPPPYNFERFPVVQTRYPVWDTPERLRDYHFIESFERRETLQTTALDAEPELRISLPGNTIIPFVAAVALTLQFLAQMFSLRWVIVFTVFFSAALVAWFWPKGGEMSTKWTKEAPPGALPLGVVAESKHKPPMYWGAWLIAIIEGSEFVGAIVSYFYLRSATNDWPPGDMPLPQLFIPTLATVILLISLIPSYLDDVAIKKNDVRGLIINTILQIVLEVIFIALVWYHLTTLNFDWQTNAYASVYWLNILFALTFAGAMVGEAIYILVLAFKGFYNAERHWGIEVDGLSSYLTVAEWVLVYVVLFITPYLMR